MSRDKDQGTQQVSITPEMIEAGVSAFARELSEVEETMSARASAELVLAIYAAMSAKVEGRSEVV